ncbi:hypothetical protein C5167_018264 [Papaver somniferum]|uniref:acylaminoacyl-peptidase n=1 Tax=Papaver somniferum TaxID=3469 RepID=A0A4Y7IQU1_PAPSO|nr:hypothetical protein C5167_018264 [Papaver somniferum]
MKDVSQGLNAANEEEFASQSTLLKEFSSLSTIDKAWVFESENGLRGFPGARMKLSLLMLLRIHVHPSQCLMVSATRKQVLPRRIAIAGKGKEISKRNGVKPTRGKGILDCLLSIFGDVHIVDGISKSLSVGQVIWAPKNDELDQYLVFVGWPSDCGSEKIVRKLGIKYCYNRPCALYSVKPSVNKSQTNKLKTEGDRTEDETAAINLTQGISSAFFPRFSPDGKSLVFLSAKSAVDTGAHSATNSLHRIDWPTDGKPNVSLKLIDVVPVVKCAEDDCFPGLYCPSFLRNPWLSDGQTMIMSSYWRSSQVIVSVHVLSGRVSRVTPNSSASWDVLALDGDNILSVSSSPVEPPEIKYGYSTERMEWNWLDISSPVSKYSTKVRSMLSSLQFSIMKIPVRDASVELTDGARTPYEAIFVSSKTRKSGACDPLIVILHGGPHFLMLTNFNKNHAFLSALGYSLLIVNYRGSLGFGEEALQSILGNVGSQDVNDVLGALDHVIEMGLADPSKVAVVGGSHGGFLTTHLIGQAPDRFAAAAARNPVCNLALMVGTTDIPDWCYVLAYGGSEGKDYFTEAPSLDHLHVMYNKSPISHLAKVKTPTLFLLGAQDLRVPVSNGLQYARALKENGIEVKVILFPKDTHGIDRPQSDFESFLNIGGSTRGMFLITQPNLLGNKKRTHILCSHIAKQSDGSVSFQWAPFPVEMSGVSTIVPSPSGQKMLLIRNQENEGPTQFEIWGPSQVEKEIHIPKSVHGSVFEGISWSSDETVIAYVAEDPCPSKPVFDGLGYKKTGSTEKDCNSWKGQGDFEEEWGEGYSGKRRPGLFVVNIVSGDVHIVDGISKSLSVGQVVWAPKNDDLDQYLVFVGWPSDCGSENTERKLGIKFCYNRPCALYAVKASVHKSETDKLDTKGDRNEVETAAINLTRGISSAFFPRFSPDGRSLVFLSAKSAVDSGAHNATNSLHRIDWPTDGKPNTSPKLIDVVPVVNCAEEDCFPGLYCSSFLRNPWLPDGQTMIMPSYWRSSQVIVSVDVFSGRVSRVTPNSSASWDILALDGDNILAVSSSPVEPPEIKYGYSTERKEWSWLHISSPVSKYPTKVRSMLSSLQYSIMKIPVRDASVELTDGARTPYEAIFVSSKTRKSGACDPLIVSLHGGPHFLVSTNYNKNHAFLSALGYSLLILNYRGSLGFGEEALQSILGKIGSQDVNDVLAALDHVIEMGLADPSKVAVVGGSHGGFLTTHLIGQAPDRFVAAAARNPVCSLALMVGTSDIPEWCFVEAYGGREGKVYFTEAPSLDHLRVLYNKSPISHLSKVKTPTLLLLGAQDLRVPVSNGLQYARALKENGVEVKVIVFPNDTHGIDRPQSDFESFLNVGVWFNKHFQ